VLPWRHLRVPVPCVGGGISSLFCIGIVQNISVSCDIASYYTIPAACLSPTAFHLFLNLSLLS